jgi:hypothetical protein
MDQLTKMMKPYPHVNLYLRASILVHVSGPMGCPMQFHRRFFMMWNKEGEESERTAGPCRPTYPVSGLVWLPIGPP